MLILCSVMKMERIIFVVLVIFVCHTRAVKTRFKLVKLQQDVEYIRYQAIEMRSDLNDLLSWRNATIDNIPMPEEETMSNQGPIRMGDCEKSMTSMEERINYIIKGLSDEKRVLREMVTDTSSKVREFMITTQKIVENARLETYVKLSTTTENINNFLRDILVNVTNMVELSLKRMQSEAAEYKKQLHELDEVAYANENKLDMLQDGMSAVSDLEEDVKTWKLETAEEISDTTKMLKHELSVADVKVDNYSNTVADLVKDVNTLKQETGDDKLDNVMRAVRTLFVMHDIEWKRFRGSLYRQFDSVKSMTDAGRHCRELGGSVVQINDVEEMAFVFKQFGEKGSFWIAGTDEVKEGEWRLPNGQLMKYTNWRNSEPNNVGSIEHCIHVLVGSDVNSKWNDIRCDSKRRYVCEI